MNRISLILVSIIILLFSSCDKLDDPQFYLENEYKIGVYGEPPSLSVTGQTGKNVLIEDFTAHKCGNCPQAAIIAEDIVANGGGKVFALAIHAGSLALTDESYPTDWTTEEGDVLYTQTESFNNPIGRINRFGGLNNIYPYTLWEEITDSELQLETPLELEIETNFEVENNDLNIHVYGKYFDAILGSHNLIVLISESHLFDRQLDYSQPDAYVEDYEFNHVLRCSLTGALGLEVVSNPEVNSDFQSDFTFNWNNEWDIDNCEVLAIVCDENGYVINCLGNYIEE